MKQGSFRCRRPSSKAVVSKMDGSLCYTPETFGFRSVEGAGNGVKICIIDSGLPLHQDIESKSKSRSVDLTGSKHGAVDVYGHGTAVAGVISANSSSLVGLAPKTEIFYAKGIDDRGKSDFNNIIACVLWAIIQQVDIILMSLGSPMSSPTFHDAIKKAYRDNIAIIAAAGNATPKQSDADFPARYPEVMAVGWNGGKRKKAMGSGQFIVPMIHIPEKSVQTTYLDGKYVTMSGSSVLAACVAGVAARTLEGLRQAGKPPQTPMGLYTHLLDRFSSS